VRVLAAGRQGRRQPQAGRTVEPLRRAGQLTSYRRTRVRCGQLYELCNEVLRHVRSGGTVIREFLLGAWTVTQEPHHPLSDVVFRMTQEGRGGFIVQTTRLVKGPERLQSEDATCTCNLLFECRHDGRVLSLGEQPSGLSPPPLVRVLQ